MFCGDKCALTVCHYPTLVLRQMGIIPYSDVLHFIKLCLVLNSTRPSTLKVAFLHPRPVFFLRTSFDLGAHFRVCSQHETGRTQSLSSFCSDYRKFPVGAATYSVRISTAGAKPASRNKPCPCFHHQAQSIKPTESARSQATSFL